ncbi:MAG: hypothetical protein K6G10_03155 [Butyrivibrio sp.]|nr:hypothetical protein [Butyrivibrio sp.]
MKKIMRTVIAVISSLVFVLGAFSPKVYAFSERMDVFDFEDTMLDIAAGSSRTMKFKSYFDYTYYIKNCSSSGTYIDCSFGSGTQDITVHIGADEQEKNVEFVFYVADDKYPSTDVHDNIIVHVKNIQAAAPAGAQVPLAKGNGTVSAANNIAMLYSAAGVPMASFSLTKGEGNMASLLYKGVVVNGSKYFDVTSGNDYASPVISESDKNVMLANGFAGVCVNGVYKNWP